MPLAASLDVHRSGCISQQLHCWGHTGLAEGHLPTESCICHAPEVEVGHPVTLWALDALDRTEPCGTLKSACKRACGSRKGFALSSLCGTCLCTRNRPSLRQQPCSCRVHQGAKLIAQSLWHKVGGGLTQGCKHGGQECQP